MTLSLKAELEIWAAALDAYDEQDFEKALHLFSRIADSSKILTNMGLIYATIGAHETAVKHFVAATNLDSYLAIAHFQCGVSNFLLRRYDLALLNFEDAYLYLRGNEAINYEQLGLKFKLFAAEIVFNRGLTQVSFGYLEKGMADLQEASKLKVTDEHGVIDEAISSHGEGYTVFSIPVGVLYRPSENKLKNSKSKDYLGKAKLVAASDFSDAFTEFTGVVKMQQASTGSADDKEVEKRGKPDTVLRPLSRSATVPASRSGLTAPRPIIPRRSQTNLQFGAGLRQPSASDLFRSNTGLSRSNTTRSEGSPTTGAGVMALRVRAPDTTDTLAGRGIVDSGSGGNAGTAAGGNSTILRHQPSLRKLKGQETSPIAQQAAPLPPPQAIQFGQYVNATQGISPLVLPAVPLLDAHLAQFYNSYTDAYTDDQTSRSAIVYSPTLSNSTSSGMSRAPSRAAKTGMVYPNPNMGASMTQNVGTGTNMEPNMGIGQNVGATVGSANMRRGGLNRVGGGSLRRKIVRRPTIRGVAMYDSEEGDDGFVTGEYEEYEMANIRVKLHYQGDVRGMTISPATSFKEFVERVTTKFGTSLTGLGLRFMDEDGVKISLRDEGDFELAIETAREGIGGRSEGKIEVWCVDV